MKLLKAIPEYERAARLQVPAKIVSRVRGQFLRQDLSWT